MYTTLISAEQLKTLQASRQPLMVFDCSFELMKPEMADIMFSTVRIQGAKQAHLDRNLSSREGSGVNGGRNPMPANESFAARLGSVGLKNNLQELVYGRHAAN